MAVKAQYSQTNPDFLAQMNQIYGQECALGKNICGGALIGRLSEDMKEPDSGLAEAGGPGLIQAGVKPLQVATPTPAAPAPTGGVA